MLEKTTVSGVLNIDKPVSLTSHDVVAHVRKLLTTHYSLPTKVGHTGTLDPFATGVLLVVIGPATRLIQFTHEWDKEYVATFTLGATSDTDDKTGRISKFEYRNSKQFRISDFVLRIFDRKKIPSRNDIKHALQAFTGTISQNPPAYSAVKIKGKKLYEYAREGIAVGETTPRSVTVHEIEILHYDYPELTLRIRCSTGTYIRSLARDLGEVLGTGAYVSSLRRIRIGQFDSKESVSLNKLSTGFQQYIHTPSSLVHHLPHLTLTSHNIENMQQGKRIELSETAPSVPTGPAAFFDEQATLAGVGIYDPATSLLSPKINL